MHPCHLMERALDLKPSSKKSNLNKTVQRKLCLIIHVYLHGLLFEAPPKPMDHTHKQRHEEVVLASWLFNCDGPMAHLLSNANQV